MKKTRRRSRTWMVILLACIAGVGGAYLWYNSEGARLTRLRAELLREPPGGFPSLLIRLGLMKPRTYRQTPEVCRDLEAIGPPAARTLMDAFKSDVPEMNHDCIARAIWKIGDISFIERLDDPDEMVADLRASCLLTQFEAVNVWEHSRAQSLSFLPVYRRLLKHANPEVRAGAADAIGILHKPAFDIPIANAWHFQMQRGGWNSAKGQLLVNRIEGARPFPIPAFSQSQPAYRTNLPDEVRSEVLEMMTGGATADEREAAARALLEWPPAHYQLRVAEWGVWTDSNGQLTLAQSLLDEVPAFVHRTGNPADEFRDRIETSMYIWKPIIHITADQPLAVDLEVTIRDGRPWFAYPMPDDFTLMTTSGGPGRSSRHGASPGLAQFDDPNVPPLPGIREGYPWAWPSHRKHMDSSGRMLGPAVGSLGVRWQSLIVSPKPLPWMRLPQGPREEKFQWWESLRDVPSSAVTSRGETEKFLYYDGPTRRLSPAKVELADGNLRCTQQGDWYQVDEDHVPQPLPCPPRAGLFIQVSGRDVTAHRVIVPGAGGIVVPGPHGSIGEEGSAVSLAGMLVEAGLTRPEADGLIRCWRKQFFGTPGRRFLLFMTRDDYDWSCPLTIRPTPTQLARVGLVLTEFDKGPAAATRPASVTMPDSHP